MASKTPFLDLYKKDPVIDKLNTFNITTMLNENWDKLDTELQRQDTARTTHEVDLASQELNKGASLIGINDKDNKFAATSVEGALKELFINVSDGKQVVATAITGKGVPTSSSDTFQKMATNINSIETDKTGDATALASDILATKTAYAKGNKLIGTIPSKGAQTYTPGITALLIEAGQYLSGGQTIAGVAVPVANVLVGTTIAGQAGTMTNNGAINGSITTQGGQINIPSGYTAGGKVTASFLNLVASNIRDNVNVGGVVGTLLSPTTVILRSTYTPNWTCPFNMTVTITYLTAHLFVANQNTYTAQFRCNDGTNISVYSFGSNSDSMYSQYGTKSISFIGGKTYSFYAAGPNKSDGMCVFSY